MGDTPEEFMAYLLRRGGQQRRYVKEAGGQWKIQEVLVRFLLLEDYYVHALRLKEAAKMPEVGYEMDRRTLGFFLLWWRGKCPWTYLRHMCSDLDGSHRL